MVRFPGARRALLGLLQRLLSPRSRLRRALLRRNVVSGLEAASRRDFEQIRTAERPGLSHGSSGLATEPLLHDCRLALEAVGRQDAGERPAAGSGRPSPPDQPSASRTLIVRRLPARGETKSFPPKRGATLSLRTLLPVLSLNRLRAR